MTTTRSKSVRVTEKEYRVLFAKPRAIVCAILPGDVLEFREQGRRARFKMGIHVAFRYAVTLAAMNMGRRIKELRKAGRTLAEARKIAEKEYLS